MSQIADLSVARWKVGSIEYIIGAERSTTCQVDKKSRSYIKIILNKPSSVNAMIPSWQNCRSGEVEGDSGSNESSAKIKISSRRLRTFNVQKLNYIVTEMILLPYS